MEVCSSHICWVHEEARIDCLECLGIDPKMCSQELTSKKIDALTYF